ncbi:MAG: hypothetical protein AAGC55_23420, partial [Myxococcota bacterium]
SNRHATLGAAMSPVRLLLSAACLLILSLGAERVLAQRAIPVAGGGVDGECTDDNRCGTAKLPGGIIIEGGCWLTARRGGIATNVVEIIKPDETPCPALRGVMLLDDGTLQLAVGWNTQIRVSRAQLLASLDLALGRKLFSDKKLAKAEEVLQRALGHRPGLMTIALTLAQVRVARGQARSASAVLAPFVARQPVVTYAAVLRAGGLGPVLDQEAFVAARAARPGAARLASASSPIIAYSSRYKLLAAVQRRGTWGTCSECMRTELLLFNVSGLRTRMPLLLEGSDAEPAAERVALPGRLTAANRLLGDLGFDQVAERVPMARQKTPDVLPFRASFPAAGLEVTMDDERGLARVVRGKRVLDTRRIHRDCADYDGRTFSLVCEYGVTVSWAAWIPLGNAVVLEWANGGDHDYDITTVIELWSLGQPGARIVMPVGDRVPR